MKWLTPAGDEMDEQDWNFPDGRFLSYVLAPRRDGGEPLFIVLNGADRESNSRCPNGRTSRRWQPFSTPRTASTRRQLAGRRDLDSAGPLGAGLRGRAMTPRFGPLLDGRRRHLPAVGAGRAQGRARARQRARHGGSAAAGSKLHVPGAGAGTRYRFNIDGELDIPDPASHFQPDDVHGPSEVIDHRLSTGNARTGKAALGRGRLSRSACRHVHARRHLSRHRSTSSIISPTPASPRIELMPLSDFPGRWNWGYDGVLPYAPDSAPMAGRRI